MQLKHLKIKSHFHLEDIEFDFTYPKEHAKAGKPLEKICLIGQSATGKTKILELIEGIVKYSRELELADDGNLWVTFNLLADCEFKLNIKDKNLVFKDRKLYCNDKLVNKSEKTSASVTKFIEEGIKLVSISSDLISESNIKIFDSNPLEIALFDDYQKFIKNELSFLEFTDKKWIKKYASNVDLNDWARLIYEIVEYRKKFHELATSLLTKGNVADFEKLNKEYAKWSKDNINPLEEFADFFNPVLNKLNLEVHLSNSEYPIPLKSKVNDNIIPVSGLSTGTKGLLLSMLPLFQLNTNDAMILIDEPERSLFPDMQVGLMEHYQNIAPNAQFIIATHSPFIAAAFEPEERFILYFDNEGKVKVRKGESPIGDDPNDILSNDFNVDYFNSYGKKAYEEYRKIKQQVFQEKDDEKKKELVLKMDAIGEKYNF
jgi:predicted ATP-dependent endonuclease of OLD family